MKFLWGNVGFKEYFTYVRTLSTYFNNRGSFSISSCYLFYYRIEFDTLTNNNWDWGNRKVFKAIGVQLGDPLMHLRWRVLLQYDNNIRLLLLQSPPSQMFEGSWLWSTYIKVTWSLIANFGLKIVSNSYFFSYSKSYVSNQVSLGQRNRW